nr:GNAT family N-acetyltransferase [Clostridium botulinum]
MEAYTAVTSGIVALPFGIYNGNTLVGFIMFGYDTIGDEGEPNIAEGNYCIWRFMINKAYQKQGFGKKATFDIIQQ